MREPICNYCEKEEAYAYAWVYAMNKEKRTSPFFAGTASSSLMHNLPLCKGCIRIAYDNGDTKLTSLDGLD